MQRKKGKQLELMCERWVDLFNTLPNCIAAMNPVKFNITKQTFTKKALLDITIICNNKIYLIDAKECSQDKFYPSKQPAHQKEIINKLNKMEIGSSFFLVWFKKYDPLANNLRAIYNTDDPATIESGYKFDFELFFNKISLNSN